MGNPKISVLLCTVRPDQGYVDHPEWTTLGKVIDDLSMQTFRDFELIIVDGLHAHGRRIGPEDNPRMRQSVGHYVDVMHVPPRDSVWTRQKRVAISTYRNTGLTYARGELVVNLDDCCELPRMYLEAFWYAYHHHGICAGMTWPEVGDPRPLGVVTRPGLVYGFGSYPLAAALELNGYDEAYDGGQGLEDVDWSTRLFHHGVRQGLIRVPGFRIHSQSGHDPRCIDSTRPVVKCCNTAWNTERVWRQVQRANTPELWTGPRGEEALHRLLGPCFLLDDEGNCKHHHGLIPCAYLSQGWPQKLGDEAAELLKEPPIIDLVAQRKACGL